MNLKLIAPILAQYLLDSDYSSQKLENNLEGIISGMIFKSLDKTVNQKEFLHFLEFGQVKIDLKEYSTQEIRSFIHEVHLCIQNNARLKREPNTYLYRSRELFEKYHFLFDDYRIKAHSNKVQIRSYEIKELIQIEARHFKKYLKSGRNHVFLEKRKTEKEHPIYFDSPYPLFVVKYDPTLKKDIFYKFEKVEIPQNDTDYETRLKQLNKISNKRFPS